LTRGQKVVLLIGVTLLGLAQASCARVQFHSVRHASRSGFGPLLEAGVEIYEYQAGLLHAKTMTVDGIWATVGSTNLDTRSFALNDEVNAVVYHNEVVGQLEQVFADDLTYARKIDLERWRSRGFLDHLLEILSLPVRPQL
jgi:cardiolipin synthase A/B